MIITTNFQPQLLLTWTNEKQWIEQHQQQLLLVIIIIIMVGLQWIPTVTLEPFLDPILQLLLLEFEYLTITLIFENGINNVVAIIFITKQIK